MASFRLAAVSRAFPSLEWMRLDESVRQFEAPLFEAVQERLEAWERAPKEEVLRSLWLCCCKPEAREPCLLSDLHVLTASEFRTLRLARFTKQATSIC